MSANVVRVTAHDHLVMREETTAQEFWVRIADGETGAHIFSAIVRPGCVLEIIPLAQEKK